MKKREPVAVITEDEDGSLFVEDGRSEPIKVAVTNAARGRSQASPASASPTQGGRMTRWPEATKARARALAKAGNSHTEIGAILGVPRGTVDTWFWSRATRERMYAKRVETWKRNQTNGRMYLGVIECCPRCGERGYVELLWMDYIPTGTRNYYWQVFHYHGKQSKYTYCGTTIDRWDGRDIVFTSPRREEELRELQVPGMPT